jgi:hypothetical protein
MARWLAALIVVAFLAGCGGGSSSPSPSAAVVNAIKTTLASHTVQENVSAVTPTASAQSTSAATGDFSFDAGQGSFAATAGVVLAKVTTLLVGSTVYIDLPAPFSQSLQKGKVWVSIDLTNPPTLPGVGNFALLAGAVNPNWLLATMQQGMRSATKVDTQTTQGALTTHYQVTVDLSSVSTPEATAEKKLLGSATQNDDLYVGPDHRLVKLVVKAPLPGNVAQTVTAVYSGYGVAVNVVVPPASQVESAVTLVG